MNDENLTGHEVPVVSTTPAPSLAPVKPPQDKPADIFEMFETDPAAEKAGVVQHFGTSWMRIRSLSTEEVQRIRINQIRRQSKLIQGNGGVLPAPVVNANEAELAEAVVTEWGQVPVPPWWPAAQTDGSGFLAFSERRRLFAEPRMRKLRDLVLARAGDDDNFRRAELERTEGN